MAAVRRDRAFTASAVRENPHVCYCRMCQKATGNLFAALVGVGHENLTMDARQACGVSAAPSMSSRGFCRNCGTPLYYRYDGGKHISFTIGAFDEPHRVHRSIRWASRAETPVAVQAE